MGQSESHKRFAVRRRVLVAFALLCTPSLFVPGTAQAASRQGQERAARKACLSGDYAKGVEILSELFVDTKDPTYIFNQARCFEQNRRYEDALARFQEFLRSAPDLDASDKAAAEKHIADCQDLLAKQTGQPAAPALSAPAIQPSPIQQQPVSPPQAVVDQQANPASATSPRPDATSGSGLRTAGIVTTSVGAAGVVVGVLLNLKANSMASDMKAFGSYSDQKESQRKSYETAAWIGYGAGAACVATGAVLYYLGLRSGSRESATLALLPMLAPAQTGAVLTGTF